MIPGLDLVVLDSQCCGLAGTYGFKTENYDTSMAIGSKLFKQIRSENADFAITDCETCKWQIEENTDLETIHPRLCLSHGYRVNQRGPNRPSLLFYYKIPDIDPIVIHVPEEKSSMISEKMDDKEDETQGAIRIPIL